TTGGITHTSPLFFSYCSCAHRDLHSFPTRRSSDLIAPAANECGSRLERRDPLTIRPPTARIGDCGHPMRSHTYQIRSRSSRPGRSEEHTSELQSRENLVCRLLLEKKKKNKSRPHLR